MATYIGDPGNSVLVRDPDQVLEETVREYASSKRMLGGTRKKHTRASKRIWPGLSWTFLSETEFSTLVAQLNKTAALEWKPPGGGTYTVHVVEGSREYKVDEYGLRFVRVTLEEV